MISGSDLRRRLLPLAPLCAVAMIGLSACSISPSSNSCAYVELEHLARPFDAAGKTRICSPKRVSAAYREQYFPGYVWGDETW